MQLGGVREGEEKPIIHTQECIRSSHFTAAALTGPGLL